MKRLVLVMLACCLILITVLAARPSAASAQDGTGDYTPLIYGDNVFSLLYPSQWTFAEEYTAQGSFVFSSDPSILTRQAGQPYAPGEITVSLTLLMAAQPVTTDDGLEATLTQFLDTTRRGTDGTMLTDLNPTIVSVIPAAEGVPAIARATYTVPNMGDGMAYLWRLTDRVFRAGTG